MTILEGDIKLLASRVMDDVPEGGGGPTGTVIPYGGSNAVFGDVTETARAGGNVSIRQVHMGVLTPTTDALMGANVILSRLPTDPNVSVSLAKCSLFARRSEIAQAVANYLIQSVVWNGALLEDHVAGQKSIQIFHRPGTAVPDIGRTLVLSYQAGTSGERIQYVRVTRSETTRRTFTYSSGGCFVDFDADVTKLDLSDSLRFNFPGSAPNREFANQAGKTIVRDTTVADAAEYYGASPLTVAAALGDQSVKVASIYTQLVPSSRTETPALDQRPAAVRSIVLATAPRLVEVGVAAHTRRIRVNQSNRGFSFVALLKPLPTPGTLVISYRALGRWYTIADDGAGVLTGSGSGRIIYTTGSVEMTLQALPDEGSSIVIQWGESVGYNNRSAQGAQVRAPEYAWRLAHVGVKPGTLALSWLSGGVLQTATANGQGKITGAGVGEVDHPSGSVFLRPTAMPDPGAEISASYEYHTLQEETFASPAVDATGSVALTLAQQPVAGSVEVVWMTAQEVSSTSGGTLTASDATKAAIPGAVVVRNNLLHVGDAEILGYPITGGVMVRLPSTTTSAQHLRVAQQDAANARRVIALNRATDDGAGNFVAPLGTVNYAGKSISLRVVSLDTSTTSYKSDYEDAQAFETSGTSPSTSASNKGGEYGTTTVSAQQLGSIIVRYSVAPLSPTSATESFTPPAVTIDLCPYTSDRIVPGSVRFVWMGHTYEDFEGVLYRGRTDTAPGTASGSVDYLAGIATLTDYVVGSSPASITLQSLWTRRAAWNTASVFFRTQAAPLKPEGLVLTLVDLSGNPLTVTSAADGTLSGDHARGRVDYEGGTAELQFGDYVDDATLTPAQKAEWWYNPADVGAVQAGKIWRPWPVDPSSLRYNSVAYFYLPLDADILGIDPVRLPPDGRVPIYRVGGFVVVGHTATIAAATYSNGNTINCGRTRLSRVYLIGADGNLIQAGYSVDLDAGVITAADVSSWVQPVTIRHRIEQMTRVADLQIDGTLRFTSQLSHAFPVGSVVSSALMAGDLRARALPVWDQQSWDGVTWLDAVGPSGPASASYNDAAFPVVVTNAGAITERFALRVLAGGMDVEVIGEHVGNLGTFSRNTEIAPINPISSAPYFRLPAAGWGSGWAAGNVLFLPTVGAFYPLALIRAVQPGQATGTDYAFEITERGDVDRAPTNPII